MAQLVKNLPAIVGDIRNTSSIPGLGRCPGEGNGNPLQYSCLESSMDRAAYEGNAVQILVHLPPRKRKAASLVILLFKKIINFWLHWIFIAVLGLSSCHE